MDDNKRMLLAVVITMALLAVYQMFFLPAPPAQEETAVATEEIASNSATTQPEPTVAPSPATETVPAVMVEAGPSREIVVDTPLYRLRLTTAGARLLSAELKNYHELPSDESPVIDLFRGLAAGEGAFGLVGTEGIALAENQPYTVDLTADKIALSAGDSTSLVFTAQTTQGLQIARTFTFHGDSYQIDTALQLLSRSPLSGRLGVVLSVPWDDATEVSRYNFTGPTVWTGEDRENVKIKDLKPEGETFATAEWMAFVTKYFMAALVADDASSSVKVVRDADVIRQTLWLPPQQISSEPQTITLTGYIGPRESDQLALVGHNLQKSMEYGIFAPLAVPLLHVLKFFYGFIGNYGWAIILLTVLIKLLFWPLTHKSYKSMKGMQKLQPKMQQLREKYKSDKQRLNSEMMQLYREHRVNPMSGCLPMVIQIPVFFALYRVLLGSIELRHAPFALWLTDLSAKDPYYITPVIMGVTMFLQQKLSPSTMDPNQAKIFMLMPVVFTFMFLNFPSGLVIYWLVNNALSIIQQLVINRQATA